MPPEIIFKKYSVLFHKGLSFCSALPKKIPLEKKKKKGYLSSDYYFT